MASRLHSSLADTTIRGASGAAQHATTLEIDDALRRCLTLAATVGHVTDAYVGVPLRDATTTFGLAASYSLNRDVEGEPEPPALFVQ